jgi:hypothetical protein
MYGMRRVCLANQKERDFFNFSVSQQIIFDVHHILVQCSFSNKRFPFGTMFVGRIFGLGEDFTFSYIFPALSTIMKTHQNPAMGCFTKCVYQL